MFAVVFCKALDLNCYLTVGKYDNFRQLWHAGPSSLCCLEDIKTLIKSDTTLFGETFFMATFFLLKVYNFHHTMLVLNAFPAISEGLDPPSWLTLMHSKWAPPIANLLHNSFSDKQSSPPPRDLPPQTLLVRLLVGSHLPVKKPGYGPASHPQYYFAHHPLGCNQRSLFWNFRSHSNRVQFGTLETLFHP